VDCPGHASLIRTIIGGAQIVDLMILVIDIAKVRFWICCPLSRLCIWLVSLELNSNRECKLRLQRDLSSPKSPPESFSLC
jgi:hypothetical protein